MPSNLRRAAIILSVALAAALIIPAIALATPAPTFSIGWGSSGPAAGQFNGPNLMAADRLGHVFVADTGNNRIQKFGLTGSVDASWVCTDTMSAPFGVATDRFAYVYVSDVASQRVAIYSNDGVLQQTVGLGGGIGAGQFGGPVGLAVDPWGFVLVVDQSLGRVQKFTADGAYGLVFGSGILSGPTGIAIDPLGNVFVTDTNNNRVVEFDSTGAVVRGFGSAGTAAGQFNHPRGLAFSADGTLLVADQFNGRVQAFTTKGVYQYTFGQGGSIGQNTVGPVGLATDGTGIYAADTGDNTVKKFTFGAPKPVSRISGTNRYGLAANVAAARWPRYRGMHHVIVVNGEDTAVADALAVSPLAGVYNAPILLTRNAKLSPETNTAIKQMRLASGPLAIHVIGDAKLISKATYNKIKSDNHGGSVERLYGHDPYSLSIGIAKRVKKITDQRGTTPPYVMVFNGQTSSAFYDALFAGPGAARSGVPMLAVKRYSVPTAIHKALTTTFAGKVVIVVNSPTYLSASMYAQVGGAHRFSNHSDHAGSAADIAMGIRDGALTSWDSVGAVGTIPAAIAGGPYEGLQNGVLLFSRQTVWPSANTSFFAFQRPYGSVLNGQLVGSTRDVTNATKWHFWFDLNTP